MTHTVAWIVLVLAGVLEVVWASGLRSTQGFSRLWPSVWVLAAMAASFYLLSRAVQVLPVGTAYAVWVGIGAVGVALVGVVVLKEPATIPRLACVLLIVAGVVGLKVLTPAPSTGTP